MPITYPASGKFGDIKVSSVSIQELKNWKATAKSNNPGFATNTTPGYKRRLAGVFDMEGTFDMLADPLFLEGDLVTLVLYTNSTSKWRTVPAIIDSIAPNVDLDNGEPIGFAIKWSQAAQPTIHG